MTNTNDSFIDIPFQKSTLDVYYIRTAILKALKEQLPELNGNLLDIGCGKMPYRELILQSGKVTSYTGLDIETALPYDERVRPDMTWDGYTMPFAPEHFDSAIGTEVLEHCPDPLRVLSETCRVLKPGAVFFFTVPFLWPLHEVPHDAFRYTPFTMERLLKQAGFSRVNIKATGGWHASMAQMLGLWVRRSSMGAGKRKILENLLQPIIGYLIKMEKHSTVEFYEGQMITGLSGTAWK